jgi:hypothetical protein
MPSMRTKPPWFRLLFLVGFLLNFFFFVVVVVVEKMNGEREHGVPELRGASSDL